MAAYPNAAIGMLAKRPVRNSAPSAELQARLDAIAAEVRSQHAGRSRRDLETLPALRPYVQHYRRFGKTYHVLLQLESVAFRGRPIEATESLVSAMFAAEMQYLLLTAGHDLDAVQLPLTADVTRSGEQYVGIGGRSIEVKPGDMSIRDGAGIISSVIYGPDQRTRLVPHAGSVLFTTYAPAGIPDANIERHLRGIEALVLAESPMASSQLTVLRPGSPCRR
jgi:DNA/RNA-binding domain of Phe-tRNA-synthetase-like protein